MKQLALIPVLVAMLAVHAVRRTYSVLDVTFSGAQAVLTVVALPFVVVGVWLFCVTYLVTFS